MESESKTRDQNVLVESSKIEVERIMEDLELTDTLLAGFTTKHLNGILKRNRIEESVAILIKAKRRMLKNR